MDNPPEVLIGQEYAIKSPSYLISRKKRHHWLPASGMTVPGWSVSQHAATSAGLFSFWHGGRHVDEQCLLNTSMHVQARHGRQSPRTMQQTQHLYLALSVCAHDMIYL